VTPSFAQNEDRPVPAWLSADWLPSSVAVEGVISDAAGHPLAEAYVDAGDLKTVLGLKASPEGRFQLRTRSPFIVVRKPGFVSQRIALPTEGALKVTLKPVGGALPACPKKGKLLSVNSACHIFFPASDDFEAGKMTREESSGRLHVDDEVRDYVIAAPSGPVTIRHGNGQMWSLGVPDADLVWTSTRYEEKLYAVGSDLWVLDARGQLKNGTAFRYLGMVGESAGYRDVKSDAAPQLDSVLDSACIKNFK
jgi:hypothetical protein